MVEIRYYVAPDGKSPFAEWLADLNDFAAAKVSLAVERIAMDNFSNVKSVGAGVMEYRIHSGPGYRIYFGRDGDAIVMLLTGGTKQRQQRDILAARAFWQDYKRRGRERR